MRRFMSKKIIAGCDTCMTLQACFLALSLTMRRGAGTVRRLRALHQTRRRSSIVVEIAWDAWSLIATGGFTVIVVVEGFNKAYSALKKAQGNMGEILGKSPPAGPQPAEGEPKVLQPSAADIKQYGKSLWTLLLVIGGGMIAGGIGGKVATGSPWIAYESRIPQVGLGEGGDMPITVDDLNKGLVPARELINALASWAVWYAFAAILPVLLTALVWSLLQLLRTGIGRKPRPVNSVDPPSRWPTYLLAVPLILACGFGTVRSYQMQRAVVDVQRKTDDTVRGVDSPSIRIKEADQLVEDLRQYVVSKREQRWETR